MGRALKEKNEVHKMDSRTTHAQLSFFMPRPQSKLEAPKVLENCTNITESSCDVTDEWSDMNENYVPIIEIYRRDSMKSHCGDSILATDSEWVSVSLNVISGLTQKRKVGKGVWRESGADFWPYLVRSFDCSEPQLCDLKSGSITWTSHIIVQNLYKAGFQ